MTEEKKLRLPNSHPTFLIKSDYVYYYINFNSHRNLKRYSTSLNYFCHLSVKKLKSQDSLTHLHLEKKILFHSTHAYLFQIVALFCKLVVKNGISLLKNLIPNVYLYLMNSVTKIIFFITFFLLAWTKL